MFYFVIAGVLLVVFALSVISALVSRDKVPPVGAAVVSGLFLLVVTAIFSATTVSPRAVGIETSFGKYVTTLDNGFHWTAPWANVEEFSTMNQPLHVKEQEVSFAGTKVTDPVTKVTTVSGSGGSGDFTGTVMWSIDPSGKGAENLWQKYRSYDNVKDNLVDKAFRESGRVAIGKYNPVEAKDGSNLRSINDAVLADLRANLAPRGIVVDSVTVTDIRLGESAQRSLDRIVEANANTERAKAEQERATIDAATQGIRQNSGSLRPEALQRYCLEVTNSWDQGKNGPLPAGWNCSGAQSLVVAGK